MKLHLRPLSLERCWVLCVRATNAMSEIEILNISTSVMPTSQAFADQRLGVAGFLMELAPRFAD